MNMAASFHVTDQTPPVPERRLARPAAMLRRGATISSSIYRQLRSEIVSMARRPGEPISEKDIAQQYGVSRTPVREALLRLADEELVDIFPQSGTFVSRIVLQALPEALVIRKALEEAAVRLAATRASGSQILRLQANLAEQSEADSIGDFTRFHLADESFHALIAECAGYLRFWTIIQQVKVQVDRCRRLTLPVPGRMQGVIAEHQRIVDAIVARSPEQAARSMDVHIEGLGGIIAEVHEANPRYFIDHANAPRLKSA
jgi:DNA-binding GntR family transcriptional regulator